MGTTMRSRSRMLLMFLVEPMRLVHALGTLCPRAKGVEPSALWREILHCGEKVFFCTVEGNSALWRDIMPTRNSMLVQYYQTGWCHRLIQAPRREGPGKLCQRRIRRLFIVKFVSQMIRLADDKSTWEWVGWNYAEKSFKGFSIDKRSTQDCKSQIKDHSQWLSAVTFPRRTKVIGELWIA